MPPVLRMPRLVWIPFVLEVPSLLGLLPVLRIPMLRMPHGRRMPIMIGARQMARVPRRLVVGRVGRVDTRPEFGRVRAIVAPAASVGASRAVRVIR